MLLYRPARKAPPAGANRRYSVTVNVAGWLALVPTVTTTGCAPSGAAAGAVKLICVTPTRPLGMPMKVVCAFAPPTVTVTGWTGFGRRASGVLGAGVVPVGSAADGARPSASEYSTRRPTARVSRAPGDGVKSRPQLRPGAFGHQFSRIRIRLIPVRFGAPGGFRYTPARLLCGVERLQRLDRVSTLAAATAHSLNDDLTVILSSLTGSMLAMEPGHPARLPLMDLERAALRCVTTASRLLDFSARRGTRPVCASLEAVLDD